MGFQNPVKMLEASIAEGEHDAAELARCLKRFIATVSSES